MSRIDFDLTNRIARAALPILLRRWLPEGHRRGRALIARNTHSRIRVPWISSVSLSTTLDWPVRFSAAAPPAQANATKAPISRPRRAR